MSGSVVKKVGADESNVLLGVSTVISSPSEAKETEETAEVESKDCQSGTGSCVHQRGGLEGRQAGQRRPPKCSKQSATGGRQQLGAYQLSSQTS